MAQNKRYKWHTGTRAREMQGTGSTINKMNHALIKLKQTNQCLQKQNNEIFEFSNHRLAPMNLKLVRYANEERYQDKHNPQFQTVAMADDRTKFRKSFSKTFYAT